MVYIIIYVLIYMHKWHQVGKSNNVISESLEQNRQEMICGYNILYNIKYHNVQYNMIYDNMQYIK